MEPLVAIVEDEGSVRDALISLVDALGFSAQGFPDAPSFLASPAADTARCLIADIRLPGLSGIELHRRLRASGRRLPIILITAYPDEATRMRVLAAGALGYLVKPFHPEELLACLRTAMGV